MLYEDKQSNKSVELSKDNTILNISDTAVFKDKPQNVYLYKKTEKLVSAIYLVSNFISDKEPIKWQLRETGIDLLSGSLLSVSNLASDQTLSHHDFVSTGFKLLSLLQISFVSRLISEMNFNILKYELEVLIQTVETTKKATATEGLIFPDHFFEVSNNLNNIPVNVSKGQSIMSDRITRPISPLSVKKPLEKSNRQEIIIGLLKKNKELGIKDFTSAIKNCSEKTIQRELVVLVSKGQINKTGEKRWSRYSIK